MRYYETTMLKEAVIRARRLPNGKWQYQLSPLGLVLFGGILLLFFFMARGSFRMTKGFSDRYAEYSGIVVSKGQEYDPIAEPGMSGDYFLIIRDSEGHDTKRYVGLNGYIDCQVGEYVLKKKGLRQSPIAPGKTGLSENLEALKRRKESQRTK
jgi:hypothetical protein